MHKILFCCPIYALLPNKVKGLVTWVTLIECLCVCVCGASFNINVNVIIINLLYTLITALINWFSNKLYNYFFYYKVIWIFLAVNWDFHFFCFFCYILFKYLGFFCHQLFISSACGLMPVVLPKHLRYIGTTYVNN